MAEGIFFMVGDIWKESISEDIYWIGTCFHKSDGDDKIRSSTSTQTHTESIYYTCMFNLKTTRYEWSCSIYNMDIVHICKIYTNIYEWVSVFHLQHK